jgi:cell division transport system ATP-binding protein
VLADEPTGNLDPTTSAEIMSLLARINASGTTVIMATHEAGIVDKMKRRVIELSAGQIVRDERQGGYATAAIPMVLPPGERAASRSSRMPITSEEPAEPLTFPADPEPALTQPSAPVPAEEETAAPERSAAPAAPAAEPAPAASWSEPETEPNVEPAPEPLAAPATVRQDAVEQPSAEAPATTTMSRPAIPVTQHDEPEQLTLAEKLGLRAPGEKPDPTTEQNVGPTR